MKVILSKPYYLPRPLKKLVDYPGPLWKIYAFLAYVLLCLSNIFWATLALSVSLFNNSQAVGTWFSQRWFKSLLFYTRLQLEVGGMENLKRGQGFLVMSNHQSVMDIPVAFLALEGSIRMVAKKELFYIPFFGWCMKRFRFIAVDRKDPHSRKAVAREIADRLSKGLSVWIAPEGTRSKTGALGEFKSGAFAMAIEQRSSIQPILIFNSLEACPKGSILVRPGVVVKAEFLKPIHMEGLSVEDRKLVAAKLWNEMNDRLNLYKSSKNI